MITVTTALSTGLREAADLLDQHPDLPQTYITVGSWGVTVSWQLTIEYPDDLPAQKAELARIVRTIGGKWDKAQFGDTFHFRRTYGLLKLDAYVDRPAVCERVVTGTTTVTIPAKAAEPERTETVETVEWRCQPLLADAVTA